MVGEAYAIAVLDGACVAEVCAVSAADDCGYVDIFAVRFPSLADPDVAVAEGCGYVEIFCADDIHISTMSSQRRWAIAFTAGERVYGILQMTCGITYTFRCCGSVNRTQDAPEMQEGKGCELAFLSCKSGVHALRRSVCFRVRLDLPARQD